MAEIPTPREFARLLRRMELPERTRLITHGQKGKYWHRFPPPDPRQARLERLTNRRGGPRDGSYVI
jgi:hypothetical protein